MDTTAGAAALGAASPLITYTPEVWSSRCAAHLGATRLCHELAIARTDAERERAALALNVASVAALGPKHFMHGARVVLSVADALRLSAGSSDALLIQAVRDANRSFADGIDHAVLDDWITTPVCGRPRETRSRASRARAAPRSTATVAAAATTRRSAAVARPTCRPR